ncbi:hypothetical protein D8674_030450 [Pyrus ussuriensis x Pyrus communis]|uniref:Uncharacterized protein n=1 Tax=Pyrus ussuriensis x Pyrus communis TaxID=2448454 RepID=A0A5N5F1C5_9ROSA|nr:hypothetical protein D8674_030450 [Pyrus ussuriensis x Pyrus communis]
MQTMAREVVDMKVIKAFCTNGIPFNLSGSTSFIPRSLAPFRSIVHGNDHLIELWIPQDIEQYAISAK